MFSQLPVVSNKIFCGGAIALWSFILFTMSGAGHQKVRKTNASTRQSNSILCLTSGE